LEQKSKVWLTDFDDENEPTADVGAAGEAPLSDATSRRSSGQPFVLRQQLEEIADWWCT
jgi:hypothetical protein